MRFTGAKFCHTVSELKFKENRKSRTCVIPAPVSRMVFSTLSASPAVLLPVGSASIANQAASCYSSVVADVIACRMIVLGLQRFFGSTIHTHTLYALING